MKIALISPETNEIRTRFPNAQIHSWGKESKKVIIDSPTNDIRSILPKVADFHPDYVVVGSKQPKVMEIVKFIFGNKVVDEESVGRPIKIEVVDAPPTPRETIVITDPRKVFEKRYTDPVEPVEAVEDEETEETEETAETVEDVEPDEPVEAVEPVEDEEPVEAEETVEPTKTFTSAKTFSYTSYVEPSEPSEPSEPVEPTEII